MSYHGLVILTIFAFGVLGIWALWDWLWERQRRRK